MRVFDSSGAEDADSASFNTSPTDINFTPTSTEAGATTVVISHNLEDSSYLGSTGSFTLTYNGATGGATPSPGSKPAPPAKPSAAEAEAALAVAFGLPSARACYSSRAFALRIQQPHGYPHVVSAEVFLGKRRVRTLTTRSLHEKVVLHGLPKGAFTIRIVARTSSGKTLVGTRTYHTCRATTPLA